MLPPGIDGTSCVMCVAQPPVNYRFTPVLRNAYVIADLSTCLLSCAATRSWFCVLPRTIEYKQESRYREQAAGGFGSCLGQQVSS